VTGLLTDGYGNVIGVGGLATNVSGHDVTFCRINFDVLDASGTKVSGIVADTNGLRAGQRWRFQGAFMNPFPIGFSSIDPGPITVVPAS
jgi:hypothetical protein